MPDHLMEIEPDERIVEIAPERLRDFKDQPFKIRKDAQMDNLIDSISRYGILNPLIVRPSPREYMRLSPDTGGNMQLRNSATGSFPSSSGTSKMKTPSSAWWIPMSTAK